MKREGTFMPAVVSALALLVAGCSQPAAPPPAPVAPTAAPAAAKVAPAASPTGSSPAAATSPPAAASAAAAPKGSFPVAGKAISIIVPFAAGGGTDLAVRALAPGLERELGTRIEILNKPGASTQVALTELARSTPDGYTLGAIVLPTAATTYLDQSRQAIYTRRDFRPLGSMYVNPLVFSVPASSPYMTLNDVVTGARATPEKVRLGTVGIMGTNHLVGLQFEKSAGVKFAYVHFDGSAQMLTAALGGNVDVITSLVPDIQQHVKAGTIRPLAIADRAESPYLQGVKTVESLGFKSSASYFAAAGGLFAPANVPDAASSVLVAAMKKAIDSPEYKKATGDLGFQQPPLSPEDFERLWADQETQLIPIMQAAKS